MEIKFDTSGFDKLKKNLDNLGDSYRIKDMFTNEFMSRNTAYNSLEQFFEASPFEYKNLNDLQNINTTQLDDFVAESSEFKSWNELKNLAGKEYIARRLKF